MDRCPNCRARLDGSEQCRRCGLELRLLWAVDRAGQAAIRRALRQLAAGDAPGALRDLEHARALIDDRFVSVLLGFVRSPHCPEPTAGLLGHAVTHDPDLRHRTTDDPAPAVREESAAS